MPGENGGAREGTETCKEMIINVTGIDLKAGQIKKKRASREMREREKVVDQQMGSKNCGT